MLFAKGTFALVGSHAVNDSDGLNYYSLQSAYYLIFQLRHFHYEGHFRDETHQSNPIAGVTSNAGWASYFGQSNPAAIESVATLLPNYLRLFSPVRDY